MYRNKFIDFFTFCAFKSDADEIDCEISSLMVDKNLLQIIVINQVNTGHQLFIEQREL